MLLCDSCTLRPVCKYYAKIGSLEPAITIRDMSCIYAPQTKVEAQSYADKGDRDAAMAALRHKQEEELERQSQLEPTIIHASEDLSCVHCKQNNVDLLTCSECGELVCGDCAYETPDHKVYCPECYDKTGANIDLEPAWSQFSV